MDNLIDWFYGQVVGFLGNFFAEMGNMGVELFALDWVEAIVLFFSQLGWALFGVSPWTTCWMSKNTRSNSPMVWGVLRGRGSPPSAMRASAMPSFF